MILNEFNKTPGDRIRNINQMLQEQFGFSLSQRVPQKKQLEKLHENAQNALVTLRSGGKKFQLDPEYVKFLCIRDLSQTMMESGVYAESPAYESMCQHVEETVRDLMDAGYTSEEACSECMNRYRRDSRYAYDDEYVLPVVLQAAKNYVNEYGRKDHGSQLNELEEDALKPQMSTGLMRRIANECGIRLESMAALDQVEGKLAEYASATGKTVGAVIEFLEGLDEQKLSAGVQMFERKLAEHTRFLKARYDAIKAGKKEFEVDGKKYPVTGADAEEVKSITESARESYRDDESYKAQVAKIMAILKNNKSIDPDVINYLEGEVNDKLRDLENKYKKQSKMEEKAKNPYAVGMAQAMKSTGDKPPLKKSTITKAHDIAKKIKKTNEGQHEVKINGKEVDLDSVEVMSHGGATDMDDFYTTLYVDSANYTDGTPLDGDDLDKLSDMIDMGEYVGADDPHNVARLMYENISDEDVEDVMNAIFRRLRMVHHDAIKGMPASNVQDAVHDVARDYVEGGIVELGTSDVRALTQHVLSDLGVKESMEENYLSLADMMIFEDVDIEQAEVVMAVRSLVSDLQDQVERLGRMVNEDLPAISDQVRTEMGVDQAQSFLDTTSELLSAQLEATKKAKEGMDRAVGMLSGEEIGGLGDTGELGGDDLGGAEDDDMIDDLGLDDLDLSDDDVADNTDATAGPEEEPLGRAAV